MFEAIARPFGMLLNFLYQLVNNYALALFLIAVVIKVILLPFQMKGKRGQLRQARLQPKISELQKKHGANKQKLNEEMGKLYKEEGINPASGCLWSFIQMPIMIALFYAIRQPLTLMMGIGADLIEEGGELLTKLREVGVTEVFEGFYSEVYIAQAISEHWETFKNMGIEGLHYISFTLGPVNLADIPQWQFWAFPWGNGAELLPILLLFMFPVLSSGAQFVSMAIMRKMNVAGTPEAAGGPMGNVIKFMPLMSLWFGFILPAALSFYWTIGTVLQIGQDIWLTKKYTKILDEEDAEKAVVRKEKEAEIEAKRLETERKKAEGLVERNSNTSKRKKKKSDRQGQLEKAAEWEKKNAPVEKDEKYEPGRVGNRRFARGRAYVPDRFSKVSGDDPTDASDETEDYEDLVEEHASDDPYEYSEEDSEYVDDSYEDFEDDEDSDEYDDDDDEFDDDDDDDDTIDDEDEYEDDDDDDDDSAPPSSEKFETKRFD